MACMKIAILEVFRPLTWNTGNFCLKAKLTDPICLTIHIKKLTEFSIDNLFTSFQIHFLKLENYNIILSHHSDSLFVSFKFS